MNFLLYNLVLLLALPLIAVFILHRVFISGKSRKSWRQQLGGVNLPPELANRDRIWIHAVSVGEAVASAAVVSELKSALPDAAVVISTTTETGHEMARKSVKDADAFIYYPFDLALAVMRSIKRVRPVVFAGTDTEIWPNFRHIARRMGVKNAMINGTVSDKTLAGAARVPWLYRWTLSNIDLFCMQSQADAERIISLGADSQKVIITGNCKADQSDEPICENGKNEIRSRFKLSVENRVFIAGSANPGEDGPVMDAFIAARRNHPDLRLIIAPRQIERRDEIAGIAHEKGLSCGWRSDPQSITGTEDVMLLDTFGELAQVYAIADVSFVGGSLIPKGCHSILQPIAQGKPVFFGPHTFKAKDLAAQAKSAGVGFEVQDGVDLGRQIDGLLGDSAALEDIRARCEKMMKANQGASKRTADALVELYMESKR
ncbi:MAG: 3-deoxy-D-manno-octulosonic acid transferase [Armatimonadetes bacterium]|nr:3-deoxy-D-manno-octulosonic acid transferase [Armatimonadota bacterium]